MPERYISEKRGRGRQARPDRSASGEVLFRQGYRVRAFGRKNDERSEYLMSVGAEIFVGDLLDFRSVQRVSTRPFTICFACPVQEGPLEATANRAVAAREAGVKLASATASPVRVPVTTDAARHGERSEGFSSIVIT